MNISEDREWLKVEVEVESESKKRARREEIKMIVGELKGRGCEGGEGRYFL